MDQRPDQHPILTWIGRIAAIVLSGVLVLIYMGPPKPHIKPMIGGMITGWQFFYTAAVDYILFVVMVLVCGGLIMMPGYRRLKQFWPKQLPKIKPRAGGQS